MNNSGLFYLSDDDYAMAEGVRKSQLDRIHTAPALVNLPWNGSKSTDFGSLIHCLVLQPETFNASFVIEPEFNKRTNAGKEEAEAFAKENEKKIIITQADMDKAKNMRDEVMCCIGDWLDRQDTIIEHAAFWVDPETGLICKCKPDIYVASENIVIDLKKTAERADAYSFAKSVGTYRYHVQKAFYLEGLAANGITDAQFYFAPISLQLNGGTGVFQLDEETTANGVAQMRSDLALYATCKDNNSWPRLPSQIQTISLKPWQLQNPIDISYQKPPTSQNSALKGFNSNASVSPMFAKEKPIASNASEFDALYNVI